MTSTWKNFRELHLHSYMSMTNRLNIPQCLLNMAHHELFFITHATLKEFSWLHLYLSRVNDLFIYFARPECLFFHRFINPCTCDPIVWGRTIHRQISFEDLFVELLIALVRCVSTKINERFSVTVCCSWVLHTSTFNFNYVLHVMPKLPLNQYFRDP